MILNRQMKMEKELKDLKQLLIVKMDMAIKPKWVSKEAAMEITGLKESALMERTVLRKGNFNVSKTGKEYRFYLKDLENFVLENSTLNQLKKVG